MYILGNIAVIFPVITVAALLLFFRYYMKAAGPREGTTEWVTRIVNKPRVNFLPVRYPMEKRDIAPVIIITILFTALSLFRLGDFSAPESIYVFSDYTPVTLELDAEREISEIRFFSGLYTGYYTLELSSDGETWQEQKPKDDNEYAMHQRYSHLFKWRTADLNDDRPAALFIRLTPSAAPMEISELAVFDAEGEMLTAANFVSLTERELFDERHLVPERAEFNNGMYFDEIYHGRTAFEHLRTINAAAHGENDLIYPYETTHPPLGKLIISIGISLFGMTPFGWRFAGALFGAFTLPVMYIFIKNLFGKTPVAVCAALLFGFDFMRFTQTRIATIDTYAVFFILLAYCFMFRYITLSPDEPFRKNAASLALSGIFFGLGCASKWVVVYAGAGLALIWLFRAIAVRRHYEEEEMPGFGFFLIKKIAFSVLFFVLIPAVIYCLSYLPYGLAENPSLSVLFSADFYKTIWNNQTSMFSYHSKLTAGHPYSSVWWQWITNARPILYFREFAGSSKSIIAAFGNPLVWWGGFTALIALLFRFIENRDSRTVFIITGYLSQLLPWLFISRVVFIYHYFPASIFLIPALAYIFNTIIERAHGRFKLAVYGFTAAAGTLFILFYPALTGLYMPSRYAQIILKWLPSWPL